MEFLFFSFFVTNSCYNIFSAFGSRGCRDLILGAITEALFSVKISLCYLRGGSLEEILGKELRNLWINFVSKINPI